MVTPSTPPLVDVIAAALAGHQAQIHTDEGDQWSPPEEDCTCSCGEEIGGWVATGSDWEWPDWTNDHAAHQARAVLAAISEAGAVEVQFGLDFGDEVSQQDTLEDVHDERDSILGWIGDDQVQASDYGPLAPVTRTIMTHVGPWERAE